MTHKRVPWLMAARQDRVGGEAVSVRMLSIVYYHRNHQQGASRDDVIASRRDRGRRGERAEEREGGGRGGDKGFRV